MWSAAWIYLKAIAHNVGISGTEKNLLDEVLELLVIIFGKTGGYRKLIRSKTLDDLEAIYFLFKIIRLHMKCLIDRTLQRQVNYCRPKVVAFQDTQGNIYWSL